MSILDLIKTGKEQSPRRLLVYGVHGVGKSSFAASAESAIFVPTEDGLKNIDCAKFPVCHSFANVMQCVRGLGEDQHAFKTVVIDSLDWLERMIWDDVCAEFGSRYLEKTDGGYGKGYTYAIPRWQALLNDLDGLNQIGMSVVLVAHSRAEKFRTPEAAEHDRFAPRLHKLASAIVQEWCDEVFFATYAAISDPARVKTDAPERVMRTCEGPTHVAKNRLGMPPELPLEFAAYRFYQQEAFANG